ncbi:type-1 angiotensin II receptor-like [Arapaima gigas]
METVWPPELEGSSDVYTVPSQCWKCASYQWDLSLCVCILVNIIFFIGLTTRTIGADRFLATFSLESGLVCTHRKVVFVSMLLWAVTTLLVYLNYPNFFYWECSNGTKYYSVLMTKLTKLRFQSA